MPDEITRYEINECGELPVSYGRYVRWEDYQDVVDKLEGLIEKLEDKVADVEDDYWRSYDNSYED